MTPVTIRQIQQALADRGFDPGVVDGIRGRKTISAIIAFQTAWKLKPDGIVGDATLARLFPAAAVQSTSPATSATAVSPIPAAATAGLAATLPWFAEAQRLIGVTEDTSPHSNPLLIGWGHDLSVAYGNDAIPWCGLFVGHCIASQLPAEALPDNPLGARDWSRFGVACEPQPGAVMVFWRESLASGKGHVGFYVAQDTTYFHILAGNQSDAVNVARVPRARFVGARWPSSVPKLVAAPVFADATGSVSVSVSVREV